MSSFGYGSCVLGGQRFERNIGGTVGDALEGDLQRVTAIAVYRHVFGLADVQANIKRGGGDGEHYIVVPQLPDGGRVLGECAVMNNLKMHDAADLQVVGGVTGGGIAAKIVGGHRG